MTLTGRGSGGGRARENVRARPDPDHVNALLLDVCRHYAAAPGKSVGARTTWVCPRCKKAKLEANPGRGVAGCWNAACDVPQSADALGLIAFFEGLERRTQFPELLRRAADALGPLADANPAARRSHGRGTGARTGARTGAEAGREDAAQAPAVQPAPDPDLLDAAYKGLLALCPLSRRDLGYWRSRGLSIETVRLARLASATRPRVLAAARHLESELGREALLSVPGFFENAAGRLTCTLTGDYALIPYLDRRGRIATVEGRATDAQRARMLRRGFKAKYVSMRGSGSHLYLFPGLDFDRIQAFTEGSVGAIFAAQEGLTVGAIKGVRCYRAPDGGPLPELAGADLGGRTVPFIPDADDPPKPDVLDAAPRAARALTAPHYGRAAIAYLPRGLDLDEWLRSLPPDNAARRHAFSRMLARASPQEG